MRYVRRLACVALFVLTSACSLLAQSNPVPFINQSLAPVSAAPGSAGFSLTITGTGFAAGAVAEWNNQTRLTEVISSTELRVTINKSDIARAGTASVQVVNPAPGGGLSNVVYFPIHDPTSNIAMAAKQMFPSSVAAVAGDFNNDGKPDVVWFTGEALNVSLSNGNGTFQGPTSIALRGSTPVQLIVGDFNGDGNLDVALMDYDCYLAIYLGDGTGKLTSGWSNSLPCGSGVPNNISAADFNQDGHLDLYVTVVDLSTQWFQIFLGNSYGTFTEGYFYAVLSSRGYGLPAIGDFNNDGKLDLAVPEGSGVAIFPGNGDGTFQFPIGYYSAASKAVATADMNHDGKLDLVGDFGDVWLGNGDGTFVAANGYYFSGPVLGVADLNVDGTLDVAALSSGIAVALGAGDGTFSNTIQFSAGAGSTGGGIADFNNDGLLDVVAGDGMLLLQTSASVSPTSLAFGNQNVGTTSAPMTATLTNIGTKSLAIGKIAISGTGRADFAESNNCGSSLAAGTSCTITATFRPKTGGPLAASLNISYQGVGSPQSIALSGTGLTPPTVTLTPSNLQYAVQLVGTTSPSQTATLTNTGNQAVNITGISIAGPFTDTSYCPSSLSVGESCDILVVFAPVAAGNATGTLSVADNATGSPQTLALTGVATVVKFSPVSVNFGDQKVGTTSSAAQITLSNIGSSPVSISHIGFSGINPADFRQSNNCGTQVAGNGSCTITVAFKPTATGARSANLSVTDNGGASPQTMALSGTGT